MKTQMSRISKLCMSAAGLLVIVALTLWHFYAREMSRNTEILAPLKTASADCFDQAGAYQGIDASVLRAMTDPTAASDSAKRNRNGTLNVGRMGINSVNFHELAEQGVKPGQLLDACKNEYVGAWYLKKKIAKYGNTWTAVGAYYSETPAIRDQRASKIYEIWRQNDVRKKSV